MDQKTLSQLISMLENKVLAQTTILRAIEPSGSSPYANGVITGLNDALEFLRTVQILYRPTLPPEV